jgi:hypothetical protein
MRPTRPHRATSSEPQTAPAPRPITDTAGANPGDGKPATPITAPEPDRADRELDDLAGLPPRLTLKETARLCRRSDRWLRSQRRDGLIKTTKIGRAKLINREEVLRFLGEE